MLTSGSSWVNVATTGSNPHINAYSSQPLMGAVRWNPGTSCLEIYDGSTWHMKRDDAVIDLSSEAKELLEWARTRRREEQHLESLMAQHPGLRDLHERFRVMLALVQKEPNGP
jgi:hypothetical protein